MSGCLDVSCAQMTAMSDFLQRHTPRFSHDFFRKDGTGCLLCGDVTGGSGGLLRHASTFKHKQMCNEHNVAFHHITNTYQQCSLRNDGPVSRREVIICYLSTRILQADAVHNREAFDEAAVMFLQHRLTLGALGRAFQQVRGTEKQVSDGQCVCCFERKSTMMFEECRHVCICISCSVRLKSMAEDEQSVTCPVCRKQGTTVPVYIS